MPFSVVELTKELSKGPFDCGYPELNRFLRQFAVPNDKKRIAKTFVLVDDSDPSRPLGFYSVSSSEVLFQDFPEELKKSLPRYPVPAMRIGKLAVDRDQQGNKLGSFLLQHALRRAVVASSQLAIHCVIVDAIDATAKGFYQKYGFVAFPDRPLTLTLPLKTIIDSLRD